MNILKTLFGSKPVEQLPNVVETVPELQIPMSIQLAVMMEQLIENNRSNISLSFPKDEFNALSNAYNRFKEIGMENTKNAKIILEQLQSLQNRSEKIKKAEELLAFIKKIRRHFGEKTLLIGTAQFEELRKKYKLDIGLLNEYTGIIPEENIQEIENAIDKAKSLSCPSRINVVFDRCYLFKVTEIEYGFKATRDDLEMLAALRKWITNKRVIYSTSNIGYDNYISLEDLEGVNPDMPKLCKNYKYPNLIHLHVTKITNKTMLIACPPEQLKEQSIEITKRAIDPIVFQYSPYGVIVHSVWGEEAEDRVFEEYKKINNLLSL